MRATGRLWLLAGINAATMVLLPVMGLDGGRSGLAEIVHGWVPALVYTNLTGVPALLLGQPLVEWLARWHWPLIAAVVVATLVFAAAGCLAAQAMLMWIGNQAPERFWASYLQTLRGAL